MSRGKSVALAGLYLLKDMFNDISLEKTKKIGTIIRIIIFMSFKSI
jgi:hypothetical protein